MLLTTIDALEGTLVYVSMQIKTATKFSLIDDLAFPRVSPGDRELFHRYITTVTTLVLPGDKVKLPVHGRPI